MNPVISIFFKNVDQGDSIILEWSDDGGAKEIGIIDCVNIHDHSPVADHLNNVKNSLRKENGKAKVSFVVLSHPHTDHFSGMEGLLRYCKNNGIVIEKFLHSAHLDPDFIEEMLKTTTKGAKDLVGFPVRGVSAGNRLRRLYSILDKFDEDPANGVVERVGVLDTDDLSIPLGKAAKLSLLAPVFSKEIKQYIRSYFSSNGDNGLFIKNPNRPEANLLSTVFILDCQGLRVFLCSDATIHFFRRMLNSDDRLFEDLRISQLPHHGSIESFQLDFWEHKVHSKGIECVISAGEKYGHPSFEVVSYFMRSNRVHCTNYVNGYRRYHEQSDIDLVLSELDVLNTPAGPDYRSRCINIVAEIDDDGSYRILDEPTAIP